MSEAMEKAQTLAELNNARAVVKPPKRSPGYFVAQRIAEAADSGAKELILPMKEFNEFCEYWGYDADVAAEEDIRAFGLILRREDMHPNSEREAERGV